ncbi:MAG: phosphatidate cytidylyltransferase [Paracoccaceae bacterium]|nr:phosphatidate cytidylyltransferase [Paracoccaceae bacterium]
MAALGGNGAGGGFADLALRIVTGLAFGVVAISALLAGGPWFVILIAVLSALMAYEWRKISLKEEEPAVAGFQILAVVGAAVMAHFGDLNMAIAFLLAVAGAGAMADALLKRTAGWGLVGALYVGFAAICLIGLRGDAVEGKYVIYWLAMTVIATDVGAYFSGRIIGGPKLWRRVSPNKTWAGLAGAMVLSAICSAVFSQLALGYVELFLSLLAALTAIVAQSGDLIESAYKRHFGVKDSGAILPGHGGVLDRLDGMLSATLLVAIITLFRDGAPIYLW